mgnify:CR=1 FL=1
MNQQQAQQQRPQLHLATREPPDPWSRHPAVDSHPGGRSDATSSSPRTSARRISWFSEQGAASRAPPSSSLSIAELPSEPVLPRKRDSYTPSTRVSTPSSTKMPQYTSREVGDPTSIKKNKQSMADLKLRRLTELNARLREDLERERIPVSQAAKR